MEFTISSKKDIEKFLSLDEKKNIERKLSFSLSNDDHNTSITFEEMKQNNFELMKEIYEIQQENGKNEENSNKKMSDNTNNDESIDGKFSFSTAKSLTNIPKNDSFGITSNPPFVGTTSGVDRTLVNDVVGLISFLPPIYILKNYYSYYIILK